MTDADLIEFAAEFRKGVLGGHSSEWMCFAISAPLQSLLCLHGIETEMMESDLGVCNHMYLRLQDGRVLDPTADQFNWCNREKMPPVYLGEPRVIHDNAKPFPPPPHQRRE